MDDMKIPDGLKALNYTKDDVPALVAGAIPQVRNCCSFFLRDRWSVSHLELAITVYLGYLHLKGAFPTERFTYVLV